MERFHFCPYFGSQTMAYKSKHTALSLSVLPSPWKSGHVNCDGDGDGDGNGLQSKSTLWHSIDRVSLNIRPWPWQKYKVYHSHIRDDDDIVSDFFFIYFACCCQHGMKTEWMLSSTAPHLYFSIQYRFRLNIVWTIWSICCYGRCGSCYEQWFYHISCRSIQIHYVLSCIDHGVLREMLRLFSVSNLWFCWSQVTSRIQFW